MIVPRRLYTTAEHPPYEIVEEDDVRQAWVLCGAGTELTDAEAEALGITAYLKAYDEAHAEAAPASKEVKQPEVEDKAVAGPAESKAEETPAEANVTEGEEESPPLGVIMPPDSRRIGGGRRGA
jgi:hypothetical protein